MLQLRIYIRVARVIDPILLLQVDSELFYRYLDIPDCLSITFIIFTGEDNEYALYQVFTLQPVLESIPAVIDIIPGLMLLSRPIFNNKGK